MKTHRKSLPKALVDFAWLLEPIVKVCPDLVYDLVNESSTRGTLFAQMLAMIARAGQCHHVMKGSNFEPVIIDWKLPGNKGEFDDGKFKEDNYTYSSRMPGAGTYLTWLQVKRPSTKVSVVTNVRCIDYVAQFLSDISRYKFKVGEASTESHLHTMSISLNQARTACDTLINGYGGLRHQLHKFIQPGKSIYTLVEYTSFLGFTGTPTDIPKGKQVIMIHELRCVSTDHPRQYQVIYHPEISKVVIPQDSLIVLGNIDWFSGIK